MDEERRDWDEDERGAKRMEEAREAEEEQVQVEAMEREDKERWRWSVPALNTPGDDEDAMFDDGGEASSEAVMFIGG